MTDPVPVGDLPYADAWTAIVSFLDRLSHTVP